MKKINNFIKNQKGVYRVAFTICILILSGIVVTVTENDKSAEAPVSVENEIIETNLKSDPEIDRVISGLQEGPETPVVETVIETKSDAEEITEEASFSAPIFGKIQKPFSISEPIYSKTMDDWRIHEGVDISCFYGAEVYSAQDGTVTDVGYDINFGNYITVKNGEYELRYTSISTDINLNVGDKVYQGQLLGTVADSCIVEICDDPHFHFEIKKNDEYVDPADLILFE